LNSNKGLARKTSSNKSNSKLSNDTKKNSSFSKNALKNNQTASNQFLDEKNKYKSYTSLNNANDFNYLSHVKRKIPIIKKPK
jgi:hypothetical protein